MDLEDFSEQIKAMGNHTAVLRQRADGPSMDHSVLMSETFQALSTTMEELHVAEEELREQNEELVEARMRVEAERQRYQNLFEFAPDGYLVTDAGGIIREANQAAAGLLNVGPAFLVGKPLANFILIEQRREFRNRLFQLANEVERLDAWEVCLQGRHSTPIAVELTVTVDRHLHGHRYGLRWMIHDVSARRRMEDRIQVLNADLERRVQERTEELETAVASAERAEQRFRGLVDGIDAIVWEAEPRTGQCTFVSRRAEEVLGYPVKEWLDDPGFWAAHLHADDREWAVSMRNKAMLEGRGREFEYRAIAATGRVVWLRESVRIVCDPQGNPREMLGLMVNISKRKKAERQLYTAKRELTSQLSEMAYLHELHERLITNRKLGPTLKEVLAAASALQGTDLGMLVLFDPERGDLYTAASIGLSPEYIKLHGRLSLGVCATGEAAATRRRVIVEDVETDPLFSSSREAAALGEYRAVFSTPLLTHRGDILGAITTFFRQPHRPPENQLRVVEMYARQAEYFIENAWLLSETHEAMHRQDGFLAILAHELRNPLSEIVNALHLLRNEADHSQDEVREMLERHVRDMKQLVDDVVDASRLTRGKIKLEKELVDLATAVAEAVKNARPVIEGNANELDVVLPSGRIQLQADPTRLVQILTNLLDNAAKFTPGPGGRIGLSVERDDQEVVVRVRDSGIGTTEEMLPHIYDLFAQVARGSAPSHRGPGIGLALVQHLVELHGGSIQAVSDGNGHGSEFVVRLPVNGSGPEAGGDRGLHQSRATAQTPEVVRKNVLIVDDHLISARLLARLLQLDGHNVRLVHDGEGALEVVRSFHPDVVLLDIGLPKVDGYEVAQQIRAGQAGDHVLLVAMTGLVEEIDRLQSANTVFDHHVIKPINPDWLHKLLAESRLGRST